MFNELVLCMTPNCPNMSHHLHCLSCSAQEASAKLLKAAAGICGHGHSITGDYDMIMRLLPEYKGGHSQPGYMLDVCKACLQELQERPYRQVRRTSAHRRSTGGRDATNDIRPV
jgi:hypothetical protein